MNGAKTHLPFLTDCLALFASFAVKLLPFFFSIRLLFVFLTIRHTVCSWRPGIKFGWMAICCIAVLLIPGGVVASAPATPSQITVKVGGAVKNRGMYVISPQATIVDAIKRAGGYTMDAGDEALIIRRTGKTEKKYRFNLREIQTGIKKFPLQNGDLILVAFY